MTQKELTNVFKYIVKKCDMLINNDHYEADAYTQDTVEDITELCNRILDGNYGKLVEMKEVNLELNSFEAVVYKIGNTYLKEINKDSIVKALESYKHGDKVELIIKAQKGK